MKTMLSHTELDLMKIADALQTSHILKKAYSVVFIFTYKKGESRVKEKEFFCPVKPL